MRPRPGEWPRRATTELALRAEFGEPGGREVAVEGERLLDSPGAHVGEAGRVDEGVLALVMLAQPAQGLVFERLGSELYVYVAVALGEGIKELDGFTVPALAPKPRPALSADVVGSDQSPTRDNLGQLLGFLVMRIASIEASDQERCVDEDQGSGFDGP